MPKDLVKRKKIREAHRSSLRRTMNAANEIFSQPENIANETIPILMQQKLTLKEKLEILREKNDGILALVRDDEIDEEIKQSDILHEEATRIIVHIEGVLEKLKHPPSPILPSTLAPSPIALNSSGEGSPAKAKVRLPKLNLKKFNGDVIEWQSFWDAYKSAIHENPELSDIDRFNYLKSLLGYSAAEAIAGLSLTSPNYAEAIAILEKRFGDKQLIINSHMDAMVNLPSLKNVHDTKAVR